MAKRRTDLLIDWPKLDERHEFALSLTVTVDVTLRGLYRPMSRQQLDIAQRATSLVDVSGRLGDERPAAGM